MAGEGVKTYTEENPKVRGGTERGAGPPFLLEGAVAANSMGAATMRWCARAGRRASWPMLAAVRSAAVLGIDALDVTVEVDVAPGLPAWTIVGLASSAVKEARERVSAALANSGFEVPSRRVTVNLSPADVRKDGTSFDLPIALALLAATGALDAARLDGLVIAGELGLDGSIRPIRDRKSTRLNSSH